MAVLQARTLGWKGRRMFDSPPESVRLTVRAIRRGVLGGLRRNEFSSILSDASDFRPLTVDSVRDREIGSG
jgi:hypothetical protein